MGISLRFPRSDIFYKIQNFEQKMWSHSLESFISHNDIVPICVCDDLIQTGVEYSCTCTYVTQVRQFYEI